MSERCAYSVERPLPCSIKIHLPYDAPAQVLSVSPPPLTTPLKEDLTGVPMLARKSIPLCPLPLYAPLFANAVLPKYCVIFTLFNGHFRTPEPDCGSRDGSSSNFNCNSYSRSSCANDSRRARRASKSF